MTLDELLGRKNELLYWYKGRALRIVDGDTADIEFALGFHLTAALRVRLLGVNAFELNSDDEHSRAKAIEAREFLRQRLIADHEEPWPLLVRTEKSDSFGRWLVRIVLPGGDDIAEQLLKRELAVPYKRR